MFRGFVRENDLHHDIRVHVLFDDEIDQVLVDLVDNLPSFGSGLAVSRPESLFVRLFLGSCFRVGQLNDGLLGRVVVMRHRLMIFGGRIHGGYPHYEALHG